MAESNENSAPESQEWDEQKYQASLAHLEQLQEQIDSLRSTIPSVVSPLVRRKTSKAQMFAETRKAAVQATENLNNFRESWTSPQTQEILAQGRESYGKDSDLSKAKDVAKYGWSNE